MSISSPKTAKSVLIVAAHPDDEVLGAGGAIARHSADGDHVSVLFLSDGVSSRSGARANETEARQAAARASCELLGATIAMFCDFPDNSFDTVSLLQIAQAIERTKQSTQPELIYTHHGGDLNIDHRLTCQAVLTAFRPQPHERYSEIRAFEVASSTEWSVPSIAPAFLPDTFVETSGYLDKVLRAYACYSAEVREEPHARSVEALRFRHLHRGRQVGLTAAEAFVTLRRIIR